MAISLTLSQIVELSGGDPRRMKQLANDGIFVPLDENRASRAARRYSISEAAIACIVARLDAFRIKPSILASLAENLRSIYAIPQRYGFKNHHEARRCRSRETLLGLDRDKWNLKDPEKRKTVALKMGLDEWPTGKLRGIETDELHNIDIYVTLENARHGERVRMFFSFTEDGAWSYWLSEPKENDQRDVYIVLNLHRILSVLK